MTRQDLMGEIVSWETKHETSIAQVRNALVNAGLPLDTCRDLEMRNAFCRAAKHLKKDRTIDRVKVDGEVITFQLTKKVNDGSRIEFDYECVVYLNTQTGDIVCPESPEIQTQARTLFAHVSTVRTASDITSMVQRLFKKNADLFPVTPKGVCYFVPQQHVDFVNRVDQFLTQCGGRLLRYPVTRGTPHGDASVREAVASGIHSMIDELKEAATNWDTTTRRDTMDRGIERFKGLKYKAELYADYLGQSQAQLLSEIQSAKQLMMDRFAELESATAQ